MLASASPAQSADPTSADAGETEGAAQAVAAAAAASHGDGAAPAVKIEPRSTDADRSLGEQSAVRADADVKPVVDAGAPSTAVSRRDPPSSRDALLEEQRKLKAAQQELDMLRRQEALLERLRKEREASARAKEHAENLRNVEAAEKAAAATKRLRENLDREKAQLEAAQRAQRATARPSQTTAAGAVLPGAPPLTASHTPAVKSPDQALPQTAQIVAAATTGEQTWGLLHFRRSRFETPANPALVQLAKFRRDCRPRHTTGLDTRITR